MDVVAKPVQGRVEREPDSASQVVRRTRLVAGWRIGLLTFAFLLFASCTWLASRRQSGPVGVVRGPAWTWGFWQDPIEWNSIKRLPSIDASLRCVFALQDAINVHVWVGGSHGVILHSPDGGQHWEQLSPVRTLTTPAIPSGNTLSLDLSLIPRAEAAEARSAQRTDQGKATLNGTAQQQQQQVPARNNPDVTAVGSDVAQRTATRKPVGKQRGSSKRNPQAQSSQQATRQGSNAATRQSPVSALTENVDEIAFDDLKHGYVLSGAVLRPQGGVPSVEDVPGYTPATLYETQDGGTSWTSQSISYDGEEPRVLLESESGHETIRFLPENMVFSFDLNDSEGWAVGDSGAIFHTTNAGASWLPQTQGPLGKQLGDRRPRQYPAPWYYAMMFIAVGMAAIALKPVQPDDQSDTADVPGIANLAISDRPLEPGDLDVLGCRRLAVALSGFIRNRNTVPPLTIAVTGEWGSGKSSVMNLLRRDLETYGMRPIWFNAWHNQTEENLFATLLQNLRLQGIPRWLQLDFLPFRWRLLVIRLQRSLLPTLLLACVVAALGGFELSHSHSTPTDILALQDYVKRLFTAQTFIVAVVQFFKEPLVLFLASLVSLVATLFTKLKAFGIDPASLLSSSTRRPSISDLDKQTSVRQQFAVEFRDVTEALGARKMVIFIDDLDRCQPDSACQVLEAINFIVSSGICFVVMGLARRPVEACVGLSFSKVAEEMTTPAADPQRTESPSSLRSRFSRQYLDKLINIEVPVPAADGRAEAMLTARSQPAEPASGAWHLVLTGGVTLLAALAIYGAFNAARTISAPVAQATIAKPPSVAKGVPAAKANSSAQQSPPPAPSTDAVTSSPPPALAPSSHAVSRAVTFAPFALTGLIALLAIAYVALTRRTGLVVHDSPEFLQALEVWKEFIVRTHTTPRAIKRFMNRVRCTAMRVHPDPGGEPLWVTLLRWISGGWKWLQSQLSGLLPEAHTADHTVSAGLRESTLVALTAIHDTSATWLDLSAGADSGWLHPGFLPPSPNDPAVDDSVRSFLGATVGEHAKHFPQAWPPTPEQLAVFLGLMGTLTVR